MRFVLVVLSLLGLSHETRAAELPSALVENIAGVVRGPETLDYVAPGQVIELGSSGTIVLAYLETCVRETIMGGEVTIGQHSSQVKGGDIKRDRPPCNSVAITNPATSSYAGTTFRSRSVARRASVHSLTPIFEVSDPGSIVLKRMDQPNGRPDVVIAPGALIKGKFYDFAAVNKQLEAGGLYEVSVGERRLVFQVDQAANADGPLLARLVRLTPDMLPAPTQ